MSGRIISGDREITGEALNERVLRAASGLANLGVGDGDAVALYLRNDFAFYEASLAATRLGAYPVPVNWHFTAEEAGYILRDCEAKALLVHADLWPRIAAGVPDEISVFAVETPPEVLAAYGIEPALARPPEGLAHWDDWRDACAPWSKAPGAVRMSMIYTSGTTGRLKGGRRKAATPEQMKGIAAALARTC